MKHQHAKTLQALFAHPLQHNLRMSAVEALLVHLDATVEHLSEHRLRVQLGHGETLVLHAGAGLQHPYLNDEGVLRLRRFLQNAGISPDQLQDVEPSPRGEQARRLVIHLDHRQARLWWLEGETTRRSDLQPHGLWSSGQRLSHRHDRDIAGQRAPLDHTYLEELSQAIAGADRVLLLGHGHGQSDLRQQLQAHLSSHHPALLDRVDALSLDDTACSDAELLAQARRFYGNAPHRRHLQIPGQEWREAGERPEASGMDQPPA